MPHPPSPPPTPGAKGGGRELVIPSRPVPDQTKAPQGPSPVTPGPARAQTDPHPDLWTHPSRRGAFARMPTRLADSSPGPWAHVGWWQIPGDEVLVCRAPAPRLSCIAILWLRRGEGMLTPPSSEVSPVPPLGAGPADSRRHVPCRTPGHSQPRQRAHGRWEAGGVKPTDHYS